MFLDLHSFLSKSKLRCRDDENCHQQVDLKIQQQKIEKDKSKNKNNRISLKQTIFKSRMLIWKKIRLEIKDVVRFMEDILKFQLTAGIPNMRWFGVEMDYNILIMDLLGPSLEDLSNFCSRKLS
ncbi:hypothetical protein C5167_013017 [Papaver somniferum]|uniref:Uncharacterized protein n=1 Tax=Papaver somniferum TaxID=3469 RepID=A0A4Y7J2I5_PAPSO|nr:hypothetical protein C5167_013017 [Papaver somniferum]